MVNSASCCTQAQTDLNTHVWINTHINERLNKDHMWGPMALYTNSFSIQVDTVGRRVWYGAVRSNSSQVMDLTLTGRKTHADIMRRTSWDLIFHASVENRNPGVKYSSMGLKLQLLFPYDY